MPSLSGQARPGNRRKPVPEMVDIQILAQVVIGGLQLGAIYALIAFGLSIIYGVAQILNFSHGTLLAVGGVAASILYVSTGLNPIIIAMIMVPLFALLGYTFFKFLILPLSTRSHYEMTIGTVLVTVGAMLILGDAASKFAGAQQRTIRLPSDVIEFGDIIILTNSVYILLGVALFILAIHLALKKTWFGKALRAVTQDPFGAQMCGVMSSRIKSLTFAFGCAVVAVAAVLYAMSFPVDPHIGLSITVKAFTIIILGGVGNLFGTLWAAIFLGLAEALTALFLQPEWSPAVAVVLLLLILVIFPPVSERRA